MPIVLAVVTAVVALVATNIQGRHDRQKELELKTDLVSRMSSTATEAVFQSQAVADRSVTRGAGNPADAFQAAYDSNLRQWRVASVEIEATLSAYFADGFSKCWAVYSGVVTDYLRLNADPGPTRTAAFEALKAMAEKSSCGLPHLELSERDWQALNAGLDTTKTTFAAIPPVKRRAFLSAYSILGDAVVRLARPLTVSLVSRHARGF